ncbi:MAG: DEAD/DEAH box helicase [Candidatus Aenigmarchaeota archaeon]|nr:DEAD/DEAH box helicase [Candidatus Aenigmarchaeota archaeon]
MPNEKEFLKLSGLTKFNPVQQESIKAGILNGENLVVSAPTASGKTLIAELAMLRCVLENKRKTVYIVPLRALASEKYETFKEKYEKLGIKVAISVGDYDSSDPWLEKYDVIILTSEKFDSLLRRNIPWIGSVGLVVADEIHIIGDHNRGPTMEILLTKLKRLTKAQFIALSATIKNAREIADWLDAKIVESDYRPVKLYEGVYADGKIGFFDKGSIEMGGGELPEIKIVHDTAKMNKQSLVFVATRKSAEATAERIGDYIGSKLLLSDSIELKKLSEGILNVLEYPTRQCERLAKCVAGGIAFHHAGLLAKQRKLIENAFKNNLVKAIVATPTLAMGVNLPAYRVLIRDAKRFYALTGWSYIPVLDYQQMTGRAGRPQYDTEGESILIAKTAEEAEDLAERYIMGEAEEIHSKLASEPVLRVHVLALIATETCGSLQSLYDFFSRTFYGLQYGSSSELAEKVDSIVDFLKGNRFIEQYGDKLHSTAVGKRVSELYIDPDTAVKIIEGIKQTFDKSLDKTAKIDSSALIELMTTALEMRPNLNVRQGEFKEIYAKISEASLLHEMPDEWDYDYEESLKSFKTALMACDWIDEATEEEILETYHLTPGELHNKISILDWLLYSAQEIAVLMGAKEIIKDLRKTRVRAVYGVKEELLPLVKLRDIGRFRARKLFNAGFTSIEKLREAPEITVASLIGPNVAKSVKKQLSGKESERELELKSLMDYQKEQININGHD